MRMHVMTWDEIRNWYSGRGFTEAALAVEDTRSDLRRIGSRTLITEAILFLEAKEAYYGTS